MTDYVIAIDQGTTGSTVLILDADGQILGRATKEFPQSYPKPGWVEHDLSAIDASVQEALQVALKAAGVDPRRCRAIGITNQRETTVVWERSTGAPIYPALVWQDRRTTARCRELKAQGLEETVRRRTGLVIDPYFSATKIDWILDHVQDGRKRAERGELAFGTIDSWLVHRLSAGSAHVTDATNASRTMLYNLKARAWDDELCAELRIPRSLLPEVRGNAEVYATTRNVPGLPDGIPIAGMAGDQQAALVGQTCFSVGDAKCTYGTGAFLLIHVGEQPVPSRHGLITTVAWELDGKTAYALEGSAFIAGAAVQWLRDGLGLIDKAADIETLARQVPDAGDVTFVPALAGLGAPHWDPDARGLICGLSRDTTAAHLARAALDGIAFQIHDLADAMAKDMGSPLKRLRVDGGASQNDLLMQFQADMLGVTVERPQIIETTALGAAYLAGLGVGLFPNLQAVVRAHKVEHTFKPHMPETERTRHQQRWQRAVARTRSDVGNR